jgi:NTP pyrophosphatase (non-canonical NTP hydrolase)
MKNYIKLAIRTEAPSEHRLLHAAMGLCTEVAEVVEWLDGPRTDLEHLREELGDIMWYVAIALNTQRLLMVDKLDSPDLLGEGYDMVKVHVAVGSFMDQIKRQFFYSKELDKVVLTDALDTIVRQCVELNRVYLDSPFDVVLEKNIAKLKARFPDKFTTEAAVNRDLDKEKVALS